MGIFQHKKEDKRSPQEEATDVVTELVNENFQKELLNYGRSYFEKIIDETGAIFKQDLNTTIGQVNQQLQDHVTKQLDTAVAQVNVELKEHVAKQLEGQFAEYNKEMKEAQDLALQSLTENSEQLQVEYKDLRDMLQKNVADQKVTLTNVFEENKVRIAEMKEAQDLALKSLNDSAEALKTQYAQINETLQKNVAAQEEMLVGAFTENMGKIIEHYLLGALGDQYDLKVQLPSIIKQMEENKTAIVDDEIMSENEVKTHENFVLPPNVVTKIDVSRLVREVERVDNDMTASAVRAKTGSEEQQTMPVISEQLSEFLNQNDLKLEDGSVRTDIIKELRILKDKVPELHMTFAVTADAKSLQKLTEWVRTNVHPQAVIEVGLQPALVAGVYLRTPNHVHDLTVRGALEGRHGLLIEELETLRGGK